MVGVREEGRMTSQSKASTGIWQISLNKGDIKAVGPVHCGNETIQGTSQNTHTLAGIMHNCRACATAEGFNRGFDYTPSCLILQFSSSHVSCPALHSMSLSSLLPLVYGRLANLAFILFTSSPFLKFALLLFFGASCACSRFDTCFWPLRAFTPVNPVVFSSCFMFNSWRPPVPCLHQAPALRSVQYKTWHRAQMQYEGEPANCKMLDDGKICMLSSKKRCNESEKNNLKCRLG